MSHKKKTKRPGKEAASRRGKEAESRKATRESRNNSKKTERAKGGKVSPNTKLKNIPAVETQVKGQPAGAETLAKRPPKTGDVGIPELVIEVKEQPAGQKRRGEALPQSGALGDKPSHRPVTLRQNGHKQNGKAGILGITHPRAVLDPIAEEVLDEISRDSVNAENRLLDYIDRKGIASEVNKVTQRINARHMTDVRRWLLSKTYVLLLEKLFNDQVRKYEGESGLHDKDFLLDKRLRDLVTDDLGVADKLMRSLESPGGILDDFANGIVRKIMKRNDIDKSKNFQDLVAQQVRSLI